MFFYVPKIEYLHCISRGAVLSILSIERDSMREAIIKRVFGELIIIGWNVYSQTGSFLYFIGV